MSLSSATSTATVPPDGWLAGYHTIHCCCLCELSAIRILRNLGNCGAIHVVPALLDSWLACPTLRNSVGYVPSSSCSLYIHSRTFLLSSYTAPAILLGSWRALLLAGVRSLPTPQSPSSFGSATPALPFLTTASADVHSRYCRRLLVRPLSCCCCRYRLFVLFLLNSSPPPPPLFCSGDDNNIERRRSSSSEAELNCRRGRKTGQAAAAKGGTLNTGWCMCAVKAEDGWVGVRM